MPDPDPPRPAARPNKPNVKRPPSNARPGQPARRSTSRPKPGETPAVASKVEAKVESAPVDVPPIEPPPVIAETVVVAAPPVPRPPSAFASRRVRQTLVPPLGFLGLGLLGLGIAYFLQAPDAALRQVPPAVASVLIGVGTACVLFAGLLALSLTRRA